MSVTVTQSLTQQTVTVTGNPVENNVTVTVSNARGPAGDSGGGGASAWDDLTGTASDVPFLPVAAPAHSEGLVYYDSTDKSLTYYNDEADVSMNIGREMWVRVRNDSGSQISNGKVVYINDALGQLPTIRLARADSATTSRVIGIATHDIGNNEFGYVTSTGEIKGLNTIAYSDGDALYLSAVTAGEMTTTAPTAPNRTIQVATVLHAHVSQGKLYCHPENDSISSTGIVDATATGRSLITAATASDARTTLGLGTLATQSATITDYLTITSAASTYQPLDGDLTSWASVTRAAGFDTFAATPSSANLASLVTGETGSGALVFGTSPTFTTSVVMPAGSLSVAAINFGDTDSGFYAPTSNSVAYASDGVQKFRFDSAGMTVVSAGGAATRTFAVVDAGSQSFNAGLTGSSTQCFGFGDLLSTTIGRFERSTSTGLISFTMQGVSSASMTFNIGHASASFRVRAAASQTANIQEWRNSSETVLASVSAAGLGTFAGLTNSGTVTFSAGSSFAYDTGIASSHRTALGSGAGVGDTVFTATTVATARGALGEVVGSVASDSTATTQNVWVDSGASVALTTGTWRVTAFYHGANATSSGTSIRFSASANWSDTNGRRVATFTAASTSTSPTYATGGTTSAANAGSSGLIAAELTAVVKMTGSGTLSLQMTNTTATGTVTCYAGSHLIATKL